MVSFSIVSLWVKDNTIIFLTWYEFLSALDFFFSFVGSQVLTCRNIDTQYRKPLLHFSHWSLLLPSLFHSFVGFCGDGKLHFNLCRVSCVRCLKASLHPLCLQTSGFVGIYFELYLHVFWHYFTRPKRSRLILL